MREVPFLLYMHVSGMDLSPCVNALYDLHNCTVSPCRERFGSEDATNPKPKRYKPFTQEFSLLAKETPVGWMAVYPIRHRLDSFKP